MGTLAVAFPYNRIIKSYISMTILLTGHILPAMLDTSQMTCEVSVIIIDAGGPAMKLAEALVLRADLQKRIAQLRERLRQSALVQEGCPFIWSCAHFVRASTVATSSSVSPYNLYTTWSISLSELLNRLSREAMAGWRERKTFVSSTRAGL